MKKKDYLINKIKGVSFQCAMFFLIPAFVAAIMVYSFISLLAAIPNPKEEDAPANVVASVEGVKSQVAQPGYFEVNLKNLEYVGPSVDSSGETAYYVFFASISESGDGVIVKLQKDSIADLNNPPAEYRVKRGSSGLDYPLTDKITKDYFDDSNNKFSERFTAYIVTERPDNTEDYPSKQSSMVSTIGGSVLIMAILLILPVRYFYLFANPKKHKVYRTLAKASADIESDLENMDLELSSDEAKFFKNPVVTKTWIIHNTFFRLFVHKMDSIIWAYINETTTRNRYASHKSYGVYVCDKEGCKYLLAGKNKDEARLILDTLIELNPCAEFGFSFETDQMYINKREKMIRALEQRRTETSL